MDPDELKSQLSRIAESEDTTDDQDEALAEFEGQYERVTLPHEDPANTLNTPEHYEPILKHCEQRLKHHSHQALHYFYEILQYRKLAGLATNPPHTGDNGEDKGNPRQQAQDGNLNRKWKLCEVHETEVAMDMKFRTSLAYDELLHLMFGKQDWQGEENLDALIDDDDCADGSMEDMGSNPLDELD